MTIRAGTSALLSVDVAAIDDDHGSADVFYQGYELHVGRGDLEEPQLPPGDEALLEAYERYDADGRVNGPDDFEAFRDAVLALWTHP